MTARLLQAAIYLGNVLMVISILALLMGLTLVVRPELSVSLGETNPTRTGLAVALAGGFGAIFTAVLVRLLELIAGSVGNA